MKRTAIVCITALLGTACTSDTPASDSPASPPISATATTISTTLPPDTWLGPCGRSGPPPPSYDHVIWVWMENKNTAAVLDPRTAPFMDQLRTSCGSAANYVDHGVHPSLPNYVAATSGGTQGVSDDGAPASHPLDDDNIFRQVRDIGKSAKSYEEAMPTNCALKSTSRYAVKHNPAAYYVGNDDRTACEHDNVSFDQFLPDLDNGLPAFSLITPDICNDMHDCSVAVGDQWSHDVVSAIMSSETYLAGRTAVFVVFDESEGGGAMPFIAVAPSIVPGTVVATELDHYSLLGFTEDALGIAARLGGAANAPSLTDAFGI